MATPVRPLSPRVTLGALLLLVLVTFLPALRNGFVAFDDWSYVVGNPVVRRGLTLAGVRWAFTTFDAANWHPLTWLSHMADVQLFGLVPAGHHLTSVLLHALGAALVFRALTELTGRPGRSWLVAALFAVHPTRMESVAWVAERKDVLCGLVWIVATWAYARAARALPPGAALRPRASAPALAFFAVGLLCKPMIVTLPLLLLLLDATVLDRVRSWRQDAPRLVREKLPFFTLAAAAALATYAAQSAGRAVQSAVAIPWTARLANVPIAYAGYLEALFWPFRLSVFYLHPQLSPGGHFPWLASGLAALGLALLTAAVLRSQRSWLIAGWLWFGIALLPVIGLVQVGEQGRADRYTYVPYAGLFAALVWGGAELLAAARRRAPTLRLAWLAPAAAALSVAVCSAATLVQLRYWHDSVALFGRALQIDPRNTFARQNLAGSLVLQDRLVEARPLLDEVLRERPDNTFALRTRAETALRSGDLETAARDLARLVELAPDDLSSAANLAAVSVRRGDLTTAVRLFGRVRSSAPGFPDAAYPYAVALLASGRLEEAVAQLEAAVQEHPDRAPWREQLAEARRLQAGEESLPATSGLARTLERYHRDLALALDGRGRGAEASVHEREAERWALGRPR